MYIWICKFGFYEKYWGGKSIACGRFNTTARNRVSINHYPPNHSLSKTKTANNKLYELNDSVKRTEKKSGERERETLLIGELNALQSPGEHKK